MGELVQVEQGEHLRLLIERIERLEVEKASLAEDIRAIYAEASDKHFCTKTIRTLVKMRKVDPAERADAFFLLDRYATAIGMQLSLPFTEQQRAAA